MGILDNLAAFEPEPTVAGNFKPTKKASAKQVLAAQTKTADWLAELGAPSDAEVDAKQQQSAARDAFNALNFDSDNTAQVTALTQLKIPAAVQHLTGMLTAYDWEFVEQAKHLRGYAVSKILEETSHPDARIRLKALQMLGNVTEVALFTERVEVTKKDVSEAELEERLRERLSRFLTPKDGAHVTDVTPKELDDEISVVAEQRTDA